MNLIFIVVYVIWMASEVWLNRAMRSGEMDKQKTDRHTLLLIWGTIIVCIVLGVEVASHTHYRIAESNVVSYAGLGLIVLGILLRFMVVRSLGKQFTVDVTIRRDHQLKQNNFYKYIRHPSYLASWISFIGFGLSLNNWISLLVVAIPVLIAFIRRMDVEEQVLIQHFGQAYLDYKRHTKRLIPFIY